MATQGEFKFIGTTLTIGFAAIAFALWKQRVILNRYGYDLVLGGANVGGNLNVCQDLVYRAPDLHKNPPDAGNPLGYFKEDGTLRTRQDLERALDALPAAQRLSDPDRQQYLQQYDEAVKLDKTLREWREEGKKSAHLQADTGRDNRILILKNERRAPGNPLGGPGQLYGEEYYMYAQDRDGVYRLQKLEHPDQLLQGMDYKNAPFKQGTLTLMKRDHEILTRLIDQSGMRIRAERPSVDPNKVEEWKHNNEQGLLLFSGLAVATKIPMLAQQVISSGSYALMNQVGAASRDGKSTGAVLKSLRDHWRRFVK